MRRPLTCLFLCLSFAGISQTRIGLRTGINITNIISKGDQRTSLGGFISRFNGGLQLEFPLDENLSIYSGPYYSGKGARFGRTVSGGRRDSATIRMNYIELPVLLGYKFEEANQNRISAGGGPYAGYGFNGTIAWKGGRPETEKNIHRKENEKYKRLDAGLSLFGMYEIKDKWGMRIDCSKSFLNTAYPFYSKENNMVFGFSLFWYFSKKHPEKE